MTIESLIKKLSKFDPNAVVHMDLAIKDVGPIIADIDIKSPNKQEVIIAGKNPRVLKRFSYNK